MHEVCKPVLDSVQANALERQMSPNRELAVPAA